LAGTAGEEAQAVLPEGLRVAAEEAAGRTRGYAHEGHGISPGEGGGSTVAGAARGLFYQRRDTLARLLGLAATRSPNAPGILSVEPPAAKDRPASRQDILRKRDPGSRKRPCTPATASCASAACGTPSWPATNGPGRRGMTNRSPACTPTYCGAAPACANSAKTWCRTPG